MQPYKAWMIQDIIEKNKRVFKIPVYQINYDWNNIQCEKLYEDVLVAFNKDKQARVKNRFITSVIDVIIPKNLYKNKINTITNIKPKVQAFKPLSIESWPNEGPTTLSSITSSGAGKAPALNNKATWLASFVVKFTNCEMYKSEVNIHLILKGVCNPHP